MEQITEHLKKSWGLSTKTLAFFRVLLAASIIADYLNRAVDLKAFYTDAGVLPRTVLFNLTQISDRFSLAIAGDGIWFYGLYFAVAIVAAFLMLIGYKTRLMTFISWVLLVSIQARNPIVLQGGDVIFRMMVFWAFFLPLSEYWSVDSALKQFKSGKADRKQRYVFDFGSIGLVAQLIFLYLFSVLLKTGAEWRTEFTAIYYTLSLDQFVTPLGKVLLKFPELMRLMTASTFYAELLMPFVLLIPFKNHIFRIIAVFTMAGLHFGIGMSIYLGQFSWIMMVLWFAMLPDQFWSYLEHFIKKLVKISSLTVYYDDKCYNCVKGIRFMQQFLFLRKIKFIPITDSPEVFKKANELNSWIVVRGKSRFYEFQGLLEIIKNSLIFKPIAKVFSLPFFEKPGIRLYRHFSDKRLNACPLPSTQPKTNASKYREILKAIGYLLLNVAALYYVVVIFLWNYRTVYPDTYIPEAVSDNAKFMSVDQWWALFAPYPLKDDGWFVVVGQYEKNGTKELFQDRKEVSFDKPHNVAHTYDNQRWRKYMMNLWSRDYSSYRASYLRYLCRENMDRYQDDKLVKIDMYYMLERTLPNYQTALPEQNLLESSGCY